MENIGIKVDPQYLKKLSFEFQNLIAKKLGYKKTIALSHVEKFMKELI